MKAASGYETNYNEAGTNCVQKRRKSCGSSITLRSRYYHDVIWTFKCCRYLSPARAREKSTNSFTDFLLIGYDEEEIVYDRVCCR